IQIVESFDLLPTPPLPTAPDALNAEPGEVSTAELEKHREAVDDLLRCYVTEIGAVPLLKPEQEQAIGRRMERAHKEVTRIVGRFGFGAKEHLALAEKLLCNPPRERFDRVVADHRVPNREGHIKKMRAL